MDERFTEYHIYEALNPGFHKNRRRTSIEKWYYLWILARTRPLPPTGCERLLEQAKALGFATDELIGVRPDREDALM
ncbi:MAG: lipocalin family protein [Candidatus Competibacteraceae bacterium]|nr:lipocalin family protein [Candidatus Competibacteraceae bacterium]MBK8753825.1 lipocalin family protein [Candidatus Competibacteraceae bacterium]